MTKKRENNPDFILLAIVSILIVFGILILGSVSATLSYENFRTPFYFLNHQIIFALLPGLILGFFLFKINLDLLKKFSPILLLLNIILLALVFVPIFGVFHGGATRWLDFKLFSFQPAEFLKLTFFIFLAAWLESKTGDSKVKRKYTTDDPFSRFGLFAFLAILGAVGIFLILQPNISTFLTITAVSLVMYFSANTPFWHSILIAISAISGFLIVLKFNILPYLTNRILVFLNPDLDPMGRGYQLKQSLIAIGSGGLWGLGLGMSRQKFGFLPESISDTIFSILAEELGFFGVALLVLLFLAFLWRGIMIAKSAPDKFSQLLALGITSWIFLQTVFSIGSLIRLIPPTGVPLPFISYGGSHLMAELMACGLLLNISKKN